MQLQRKSRMITKTKKKKTKKVDNQRVKRSSLHERIWFGIATAINYNKSNIWRRHKQSVTVKWKRWLLWLAVGAHIHSHICVYMCKSVNHKNSSCNIDSVWHNQLKAKAFDIATRRWLVKRHCVHSSVHNFYYTHSLALTQTHSNALSVK